MYDEQPPPSYFEPGSYFDDKGGDEAEKSFVATSKAFLNGVFFSLTAVVDLLVVLCTGSGLFVTKYVVLSRVPTLHTHIHTLCIHSV